MKLVEITVASHHELGVVVQFFGTKQMIYSSGIAIVGDYQLVITS